MDSISTSTLWTPRRKPRPFPLFTTVFPLIILILIGGQPTTAFGLILVAEGNQPISNVGWPTGSENVANLPSRLGYWEGPPFGGGEYHFQFRSEGTDAFNKALQVFSEIKAPHLRLIVYDRTHHSRFLKGSGEDGDARVDWEFVVWSPRNWHTVFNHPANSSFSDHPNFRTDPPPPTIYLYLGDSAIEWDDVAIPENIDIGDERADAPGRLDQQGGRIQGYVYDIATGQIIDGARLSMTFEYGPHNTDEGAALPSAHVDDTGEFELTSIPTGRFHIIAEAPGYASRRIITPFENFGKSIKEQMVITLSKQHQVSGKVIDADGDPLAEAVVQPRELRGIDGRGYISPQSQQAVTDAQGRFQLTNLPEGVLQLRCRYGSLHQKTAILKDYRIPARTLVIQMEGTGTVSGKVALNDQNRVPHVHLFPIEGETIGKWSGSMRCQPDGSFEFTQVPPGDYFLSTQPDRELDTPEKRSEHAVAVTVKSGESTAVHVD